MFTVIINSHERNLLHMAGTLNIKRGSYASAVAPPPPHLPTGLSLNITN